MFMTDTARLKWQSLCARLGVSATHTRTFADESFPCIEERGMTVVFEEDNGGYVEVLEFAADGDHWIPVYDCGSLDDEPVPVVAARVAQALGRVVS